MVRLGWLALLLLLGAGPLDDATSRGSTAWERGDWSNALVHWSDALTHARAADDAVAETDLLIRLAAAYRRLGRYETARATLELAADRAPDDGWTARVTLATGLVDLDLGQARAAEKAFQTAFREFQKRSEPRLAADAALDLGLARQARGDHSGAHKAYSGALKLYRSLDDRTGEADVLTNLGALQRRDGDLGQARQTLESAVEAHRAAGAVAGEADALSNLGLVLQDLGRDDEARALYEAALASARSRKDVARQAQLLQGLGQIALRDGDIRTARAHFQGAEKAWMQLGREAEARSVALDAARLAADPATALLQVAKRARQAGDRRNEALATVEAVAARPRPLEEDVDRLERARALGREAGTPQVVWRSEALLGRVALHGRAYTEAIAHLNAAVTELERTRRGLAEDDAQRFVEQVSFVYRDLVDALVATGDHAGAFLHAQRLQAAETGPTLPADDPAAAEVMALAREEAQLVAALEAAHSDEAGVERAAALQVRLDEVRVAFADTVDELRTTHPEFHAMVRIAPEDLEAVQRELPPGTTVLQPVPLSDRLVLLVFTSETVTARTVDVPGDEVARTVGRLARLLQAGAIQDPAWTTTLAEHIGGWLVEPIDDLLKDTEVLAVATTGPFRQLPFGLLRHDGRYLAERTAVVGVTHVGSLRARDASDPRFHLSAEELLLIGNPDGTLPGAEEEVARIATRFPGARSIVGQQATRQALFSAARGKQALHLATHGMIDPQRPARSHLVLAGDEGRLGYREIPGLAPVLDSTRLVVLSACESGRPVEARATPEEEGEVVVSINGLAAQFRRAGVETMVASLWRVDDDGTRELMDAFYKQLAAGHDVARAMQRAQLELLAQEERSHPWFWAGFQVVGDWR